MCRGLARTSSYVTIVMYVALQTSSTYGKKGCGRDKETVPSRFRLGYDYPWQYGMHTDEHRRKLRVCGACDSHTLQQSLSYL